MQGPGGQVLPNGPQVGWQYRSQQEATDLGPDGRPTQGVRVFFTMSGSDASYSVFVPRALYNDVNVRAAIAEYAGRLQAVSNLQG